MLIRLFCLMPGRQKIFADDAGTGQLINWTAAMFSWGMGAVKRTEAEFVVLPKRWIVERAFAWPALSRRLDHGCEINPRQILLKN